MVDHPLEVGIVDVRATALPSLVDQVPGIYAFWREHLFRDDTARIAAALWPLGAPRPRDVLLELGCGPGFYARRFASRFPGLRVIGLDRSAAQLDRARTRLAADGAGTCTFELGDATALPYPDESIDAIVSARLLAAVRDPARVVAEAHRVLRPGGRYFIAEPRSSIRAAVPIAAMRLAAHIEAARRRRAPGDTDHFEVLDAASFRMLLRTRDWGRVTDSVDGSYQYALLEKGGATR
jgi:arsenite methyltransferase